MRAPPKPSRRPPGRASLEGRRPSRSAIVNDLSVGRNRHLQQTAGGVQEPPRGPPRRWPALDRIFAAAVATVAGVLIRGGAAAVQARLRIRGFDWSDPDRTPIRSGSRSRRCAGESRLAGAPPARITSGQENYEGGARGGDEVPARAHANVWRFTGSPRMTTRPMSSSSRAAARRRRDIWIETLALAARNAARTAAFLM